MLALQCAQDAYRPCYWSARDRGRNFANTMEIAVAMTNDSQLFKELQAQGRLSITSVNQIENAIPLCPLCHDAFDESSSPDEESNSSGHRGKKRPTDLKWKWGPRATSQTAMKFYDDVYHLPHEHGKEVFIEGIAQGHE